MTGDIVQAAKFIAAGLAMIGAAGAGVGIGLSVQGALGGGSVTQCSILAGGQYLVPDDIEDALEIADATGGSHNQLAGGVDDAELPEGAIAAEGMVPATPELEAVALFPVGFLVHVIADLFAGSHGDPFGGDDLLALPLALLEVQLAEFGNVFGA